MRFTIGLLGLLLCGYVAQRQVPAKPVAGLQAPVTHPSPKPVPGEEECFDYTKPIPLGKDYRGTGLDGQQKYRHCA